MALRLRNTQLGRQTCLGREMMARPGLQSRSRPIVPVGFGARPGFIYREKQKKAFSLSKNVVNQIRKLINRHIHYHSTQGRLPAMLTHLKRGFANQLKRQTGKQEELQKEMAVLRKLWNNAFSRTAKSNGGPSPQILKKTVLSLGGRIPSWLKSQLRVMARNGGASLARGQTVLLVRPSAGRSARLEEPGHSGSREGLQALLNLLDAVPETSPALRRLVRSIRRRNLPVILPPSHSNRPKSDHGAHHESDTLRLRKPLSGVLRMRIEPPEAARALARHLPLDNIPLVFKKTAQAAREPVKKETGTKASTGGAGSRESLALSDDQLKALSETTRKMISKDLISQLPPSQVRVLADQVCRVIESKLSVERHRRGFR